MSWEYLRGRRLLTAAAEFPPEDFLFSPGLVGFVNEAVSTEPRGRTHTHTHTTPAEPTGQEIMTAKQTLRGSSAAPRSHRKTEGMYNPKIKST